MPATSPEAIERKQTALRLRRAKKKQKQLLALLPQTARRMKRMMMPRLPDNITKAELREMLAQAAANTARM